MGSRKTDCNNYKHTLYRISTHTQTKTTILCSSSQHQVEEQLRVADNPNNVIELDTLHLLLLAVAGPAAGSDVYFGCEVRHGCMEREGGRGGGEERRKGREREKEEGGKEEGGRDGKREGEGEGGGGGIRYKVNVLQNLNPQSLPGVITELQYAQWV